MVKPVNVNEMVLRVGALLRRAQMINERRLPVHRYPDAVPQQRRRLHAASAIISGSRAKACTPGEPGTKKQQKSRRAPCISQAAAV